MGMPHMTVEMPRWQFFTSIFLVAVVAFVLGQIVHL